MSAWYQGQMDLSCSEEEAVLLDAFFLGPHAWNLECRDLSGWRLWPSPLWNSTDLILCRKREFQGCDGQYSKYNLWSLQRNIFENVSVITK